MENELEVENKIKEILSEVFKDLIISTKQTFELFLKEKNASDLIALYDFYYYTAKWQKTNQPRATIHYVMKGLKWGEKKTRDRKQYLIKLGLIQDIRKTDKKGRTTGWYIKINYIWGENTILNRVKSTLSIPATLAEKPQGGQIHRVEVEPTNALSDNSINALSNNNRNIAETSSALPFSLKDELTKLKTNPKRHIQLIGEYLEEKRVEIENKEQLKVAIKRHLRAAADLAKFSDKQISWASAKAAKDYPEWTIETCVKLLTK